MKMPQLTNFIRRHSHSPIFTPPKYKDEVIEYAEQVKEERQKLYEYI